MGGFLEAYRRHFGGADSTFQLYTGFVLFILGATTALCGILVVLAGEALIGDIAERRQFGIFLAALGFPLVFAGIQLTLPSRRAIYGLIGIGALVCLYGVIQFTQAWPHEWNQPGADRSSEIIGLYTLGLVILFTTTGIALVINFVSRYRILPGHEPDDIFTDPSRPVTVEEILADIERETGKQNLSWGGLSGDRIKSQVIKLKAEFGPDYVISGGSGTKSTEIEDDEDESAYRALMKMRGRDLKEQSDQDDTISAVQALVEMRRAQQAERERSWWYRFKRWVVTLFTGGKRGPPPQGPKGRTRRSEEARDRTPTASTTRSD